MSEVKVTKSMMLTKRINGKTYPIFVDFENETIKINLSKHGGSDEQLTELLQDIADTFGTQFKVEKHIHKHGHSHHVHDENLEKA